MRSGLVAGVLALASVGGVLAVAPAYAAPGGTGGVASSHAAPLHPAAAHGARKVKMPMRVVRIDEAVAKAHGFAVRTDSSGHRYVVKAGARSAAKPRSVVSGNCGSAYMWLYPDGSHDTTASTGFDVVAPAIAYSWNIAVGDDAGVAHHSWGGGLAFDSSWSGSWTSWHSVTGYSWAEVVSGYAVLYDGEVCSSLYPWDWTDVY